LFQGLKMLTDIRSVNYDVNPKLTISLGDSKESVNKFMFLNSWDSYIVTTKFPKDVFMHNTMWQL